MITYRKLGFNGRFGNQLFQFASTIGIGDINGYDVVFPQTNVTVGTTHKLDDGTEFIANVDLTKCFDIDPKYFSDNIIVNSSSSERFFHFDSNLFSVDDFTDINGYLQSDKYFKHCNDKIVDILKFNEGLLEDSKTYLPKTDKKLVAVHVRRGDYLVLGDFHPFIGLDYLNRAFDNFDKSKHHFVVCSDDFDWCNDQFGQYENFSVIKSPSYLFDFCLMSLCDHHIISNSSFSWWSSYLSRYENKIVIAPDKWFGPRFTGGVTDDLYRDEMIRI